MESVYFIWYTYTRICGRVTTFFSVVSALGNVYAKSKETFMVTRKDIAQRANVSVSVVSRALNNSGYVAKDKKEKIIEIAQELGYRSGFVLMAEKVQKTRQVIFICDELENAYNIELYEGMLEEAKKHGYMVLIQGDLDFERIPVSMAEGVILPSATIATQYVKTVGKKYSIPAVSAAFGEQIAPGKIIPIVECDLWNGASMIEEYLQKKGHRDIAVIMPFAFRSDNPRTDAWRTHIKDFLGKRIEDYYIGVDNNGKFTNMFEQGVAAANQFLERGIKATAVIGFNDEMALGFYKRIRKLGIKIPEDLSIISYDGTYSRRYADMELTSLALNARLQGKKCMEVLWKMIQGEKYKYVTRIPLKIVEGESVKTIQH